MLEKRAPCLALPKFSLKRAVDKQGSLLVHPQLAFCHQVFKSLVYGLNPLKAAAANQKQQ
jgi:hypothetical protein